MFAPGGVVDLAFPYTYESAQNYSSNYYFTRSGKFQSGYFLTDLKNRGLINATTGPQLKNFPYYEDASVIYSAIHTFMTSFVSSYYSQDSVVAADKEIQAWVKECNGAAKVMDFPTAITKTSTLIDVLTHMVCKPNCNLPSMPDVVTDDLDRLIFLRLHTTPSTRTSSCLPRPPFLSMRCPFTVPSRSRRV